MPEKLPWLSILLTIGGFVVTGMVSTILFFLKRTLNTYAEASKALEERVGNLEKELARYKMETEREYLSLATWREWKQEFSAWQRNIRDDLKQIFDKIETLNIEVSKIRK